MLRDFRSFAQNNRDVFKLATRLHGRRWNERGDGIEGISYISNAEPGPRSDALKRAVG